MFVIAGCVLFFCCALCVVVVGCLLDLMVCVWCFVFAGGWFFSLYAVCCVLFVVRCLSSVACRSPFAARCSSRVVRRLSFVVCRSLFVAR